MSGSQRREQLVDVGRKLFAAKGFEAVSVEEVASKAEVSKPVIYEHFGGKEGLYAVIVDREVTSLIGTIMDAMTPAGHPRELLANAALGMLTYIEDSTDGFRILVRDSAPGTVPGSFASTIQDIADKVEGQMASEFGSRGYSKKLAPMYAQMLVGMVSLTGQWWVDVRKPKKEEVAAHLVNLAWNGLGNLDPKPAIHKN
ncbi:MAG: AcrR family transcriptional regulator [Actinomycetes bacterium]|jgi:AcrR family transcriptional regulator